MIEGSMFAENLRQQLEKRFFKLGEDGKRIIPADEVIKLDRIEDVIYMAFRAGYELACENNFEIKK
jgi:hypothetical protein